MDPKLSGAFPIEQTNPREIEVHQAKSQERDFKAQHDKESMAHRELDTQLEYQRPEELFPNIPEWQSLIALQSDPVQLSRALLSISLPLSVNSSPFLNFSSR